MAASDTNFAFVGYDAVNVGGTRKSSPEPFPDDKIISRQLDELERISTVERDKHLGKDYFSEVSDFFDLSDDSDSNKFINFRPKVRIPQLQTLVLNEATDITDSSPKIYIVGGGEREKPREKWFQAWWRQQAVNNRILESFLWAMLTNLGFLQVGFDPRARRGKGTPWVSMRHPESVSPDPYAKNDSDWSWVGWEDWMYIDDVKRQWPERGRYVKPHLYMGDPDPYGSVSGSLEFPEASPLSNNSFEGRKIFRDNRVRVRTYYLFDNTREKVKDYAGSKSEALGLVHPRFEYAYPDGRWITECEGIVLADGNNWCPQLPDDDRGTFPLVRISAMPCITNFWGPAPIKLSRSLQNLSERLYTQTFENVIRTNNGVIILENNSGLDAQAIGWLPGEVLTINAGSKPPVVINPQAIPQHMTQIPASLLALQKELHGYSQARQGTPAAGNTSPDLFDASIWQSQAMTRLRGRMLSESLQRLASISFYVAARYKVLTDKQFTGVQQGEPQFSEWSPIDSLDKYDAYLDEGSLRVLSGTALKSVVSAMAKANMLPTKFVLDTMDIPNSDELAEEKMRELELAAMGKLKRPR